MTGRKDKRIQAFVRKFEGKIPLGRCRSREEDNIKIDFKQIGWHAVNWIYLA
jgi:hypothetical protein